MVMHYWFPLVQWKARVITEMFSNTGGRKVCRKHNGGFQGIKRDGRSHKPSVLVVLVENWNSRLQSCSWCCAGCDELRYSRIFHSTTLILHIINCHYCSVRRSLPSTWPTIIPTSRWREVQLLFQTFLKLVFFNN